MGRALIIGGGIAGTVSAIALKKAGWEPVVYEAYERTADGIGAFLVVAVNGMATLESIGLRDLIKGKSTDIRRMAIHLGARGKKLAEFPVGTELADGTVNQAVLRSDLYVALRDEAVRRGVPVQYRKRLAEAERTATGVRAMFEDGSHAEGDLLVGADGLHSRVRRIIDPAAPAGRYIQFLDISGETTTGISVDGEPGVCNKVFGRRCFFCYVPHPDGRIWWLAHPRHRRKPTPAQLAAITDEQWRAELLELFRGDRTSAARIIEATSKIHRPQILYDFPTMPVWHRDRMIIVGDAAHGNSPAYGRGASMAIEDAVTLAMCLRDVSGVERAFGGYERLRQERVEEMVMQGKRKSDQKITGLGGWILRDFFLAKEFRKGGPAKDRDLLWNHIDWDERIAV